MSLTSELKGFARQLGVDMIGVAPIERFEDAPAKGGINPAVYVKKAASVVVLASRIPAAVRDAAGPYTEEGKTYGPYLWYGYGWLNWFLSESAYRVSNFLEDRGFAAIPFTPTGPTSMYRRYEGFVDIATGQAFSADISHRHAAVAAGLGLIGFSGLFLTPRFGSRQRLVSVVTSAPLDADPVYSGPALCDPQRCGVCIKSCPTSALNAKETHRVTVAGAAMEYASVNYTRCIIGVAGFMKKGGARTDHQVPPPEVPLARDYFKKVRDQRNPIDFSMTSEPVHMNLCGLCLLACPAPIKPKRKAA